MQESNALCKYLMALLQFLDRCVPPLSTQMCTSSPSNSSILITTYFTFPACPCSGMAAANTSSGMWLLALLGTALGRQSTCSEELSVYMKGRKPSARQSGKAGHAADRDNSSQVIFLDTAVGKPV